MWEKCQADPHDAFVPTGKGSLCHRYFTSPAEKYQKKHTSLDAIYITVKAALSEKGNGGKK